MDMLVFFLLLPSLAIMLTTRYFPEHVQLSIVASIVAFVGYVVWRMFIYTHLTSPLRHLPEPPGASPPQLRRARLGQLTIKR